MKQLETERRRLAALVVAKEVLMQRLALQSLQHTADMLHGSRERHRRGDVRTTTSQQASRCSQNFREG